MQDSRRWSDELATMFALPPEDLGNNSVVNISSANSNYSDIESDAKDVYYRHSPIVTFLLCTAYIILIVFGLLGNALVVRVKRMRTVTNLLLGNLASADLLVLLFCMPFTLLGNIIHREYFILLIWCWRYFFIALFKILQTFSR